MSRQYPIWNKVTACIYKSFTGWGVKDTGATTICVGSSSKNSYDFLDTCVTKRDKVWKGRDCVVFSYSVDGVVLKQMIFNKNKKGKADTPIKVISKLNKIKSLESISM